MATGLPNLVLNGSALSNPNVGQGAYTRRLLDALKNRLGEKLLTVIPATVNVDGRFGTGRFFRIPGHSLLRHDLLRQIIDSRRILGFVRENFPDAVFHSPGPIAGGKKPRRTVVTIHDCIYRSFPNYLGRFFIRRAYVMATERFAAQASLVLTDSAFSRDELVTKVKIDPHRIEVLYPWVGNEFLAPISQDDVARLRRRLDLPSRFWLYLGGYDYRKNIELLLGAYAKAGQARRIPPLVLAGTIPSRASRVTCDVLGTLKRLQLGETQVRLPGRIAADDLPVLYKAASLLVYPSLMEGFGLPPAEAMAVGTPVLASDTSSLPEVIPNPTCLFDPTKLFTIAEKLLEAADDESAFTVSLPSHFTETYGVNRYLDIISRLGPANTDV